MERNGQSAPYWNADMRYFHMLRAMVSSGDLARLSALRHDSGPCRSCAERRILCAFGLCPRCHQARTVRQVVWRGEDDRPVELCCGWWGSLGVLPWTCPSCGGVRRRRRA